MGIGASPPVRLPRFVGAAISSGDLAGRLLTSTDAHLQEEIGCILQGRWNGVLS